MSVQDMSGVCEGGSGEKNAPRHHAEAGIAIPARVDYPPKPEGWLAGRSGAGECAKCGAWWQGFNTCHCTGCCHTFTSQSAADKHRTGSHAYDTRRCVDPAAILDKHGARVLVDAGRDYPCWGFPRSESAWWNPGGDAA